MAPVLLITGAGRGIGAATARLAAAAGWRVCVNFNSHAAEAEALVARGVPPEARKFQARVVVHLPAERLAERVGPWIGTVETLDDDRSVLVTGAERIEDIAVHLGMLGADFRVTEPPELVEALRALAVRYAAGAH